MARIVSLDAIDDQAFRSQIRFSNQIELALVADAQASSEPFGQHASRVTRGLNGKVEQLVSFQDEDGSIQDIPEPQASEVPGEMSTMIAFIALVDARLSQCTIDSFSPTHHMTIQVALVFLLTSLIHLMSMLSYAIRIAGVAAVADRI